MASAAESGEKLPLWTPRKTVLRFLILSLVLVVGALCCVLLIGSVVAQVVGWLGLVFFGTGFLWMAVRVVHPRPVVVLSSDGLIDRASLASCGFVPWSNLDKAHVRSTQFTTPLGRPLRQKFVVLPFKDVEAGLAELPRWKQALFRVNARLVSPTAGVGPGIPASQLPMTAEAFAGLVNDYAANHG